MTSPSATEQTTLQLPRRAEHFTGRQAEIDRLVKDLQPGRIVTLCSPGGVGKSTLAAEALWRLTSGDELPVLFPDGIIYHDFSATQRSVKHGTHPPVRSRKQMLQD